MDNMTVDRAPADADLAVAPSAPDNDSGTGRSRLEVLGRRLSPWAIAVSLLILLAYAVRGGMPVGQVVLATLMVAVTQVFPGVLVWRAVRPIKGWWIEDLAIGFAIGSVFAIGAQVVSGLAEERWIAYTPILIGVVLFAIPAVRIRILTAETRPLPWWWGPSIAAVMLVTIPQLRSFFRQEPLNWGTGARTPYNDAYLHLSLVAQLAHRGPTTFPWVQSEALKYHWFSHAWMAQVGVTSGSALDAVLFRFTPVLMPFVVVIAIAAAALRLSNRAWTGPVAALVAIVGGTFNVFAVSGGSTYSPIAPLSPSLALAIPMLVALVIVLALSWNRSMGSAWGIVLVVLLSLGSSGTKGSTLPLVVAGLGLALVAMFLFNREHLRKVIIDLLVVGAVLVFTLIVIFAGSGEGLHLSVHDSLQETPAAGYLGNPGSHGQALFVLLLTLVGILARGIAMFALPFSRNGRRSPLTWLLIGGVLAGAGAAVVFAHPGSSQWYFELTAAPLIAIGAVLGLGALLDSIAPEKRLRTSLIGIAAGPVIVTAGPILLGPIAKHHWDRALAMVAIAGVITVVVALIGWSAGRTRTERTRLTAMIVSMSALSGSLFLGFLALKAPPVAIERNVPMTTAYAVSRDQINAARYIRDHSGVNDLVMTNRHCISSLAPEPIAPAQCDNRWFLVSAFSERQVLVEAWTATPRAAQLGPVGREAQTVDYWNPQLLELNDRFIANPTAADAAALEKDGVKWIYVDHTRPYATTLAPFATLKYHNAGVDVYEFPTAGN